MPVTSVVVAAVRLTLPVPPSFNEKLVSPVHVETSPVKPAPDELMVTVSIPEIVKLPGIVALLMLAVNESVPAPPKRVSKALRESTVVPTKVSAPVAEELPHVSTPVVRLNVCPGGSADKVAKVAKDVFAEFWL